MSDCTSPPEPVPNAYLLHQPLNIMRLPTVMQRTGLARSTIYQMLGRGLFPRPINLGERAVGWLTSEVDEWLVARVRDTRGNVHPTDGN